MHQKYAMLGAMLIACMPTVSMAAKKVPPPPIRKPIDVDRMSFGFKYLLMQNEDESAVDVLIVIGVTCKGPVDNAKIKQGDYIYAIDGKILNTMNRDRYNNFLKEIVVKPSTHWQIARPSITGKPEIKDIPVGAAVHSDTLSGDESCGQPDEEG